MPEWLIGRQGLTPAGKIRVGFAFAELVDVAAFAAHAEMTRTEVLAKSAWLAGLGRMARDRHATTTAVIRVLGMAVLSVVGGLGLGLDGCSTSSAMLEAQPDQ